MEAGSDDESDDDKGPRKRRNLNEIVIGSDDDPDYEWFYEFVKYYQYLLQKI